MTLTPTQEQQYVHDQQALGLLITAPAGCGKTEALALRVAGLLARNQVTAPRKILVTTFSNRSRENVSERLRAWVPAGVLGDRVVVRNFHGLSERIYRSHAATIGHDPTWEMPRSNWILDQCRQRGLTFKQNSAVVDLLQRIKRQSVTDGQVEQALRASGQIVALELELQRRDERHLTYDDLPRLAQLILANDAVASLYRSHFGAVLVDEFQDLTPQQLSIINRIGLGKTTYAGDLAQGIYAFAGADPALVLERIEAEIDLEHRIVFSTSHRSSPSVLQTVNALVPLTGGTALTSARPEAWPHGGLSAIGQLATTSDEAAWVLRFCTGVLRRAPKHRIGVIARSGPRRRFVQDVLEGSDLPCVRWDDPTLDGDTAKLMKAGLARLTDEACTESIDLMAILTQSVDLGSVQDTDTRTALVDALGWAHDLITAGEPLVALRRRIRTGLYDSLLTTAGVHLLTGHVGKGQQFDWVVVVGLEDGCLPDFRSVDSPVDLTAEACTLSVMVSRARHGVILLSAAQVEDSSGYVRSKMESRFLAALRASGTTRTLESAGEWLNSANWNKLAGR